MATTEVAEVRHYAHDLDDETTTSGQSMSLLNILNNYIHSIYPSDIPSLFMGRNVYQSNLPVCLMVENFNCTVFVVDFFYQDKNYH